MSGKLKQPNVFSVSVVYHDSASKECRMKLAEAYALNQKLNGLVGDEDLKNLRRKLTGDQNQQPESKRQRQKMSIV